jgi:hypothetical protein
MINLLAQAVPPLPDPNHFASVGWVIVILVAVLVGANQVLSFYKEHIAEKPKPSDTYVTIPNFKEIEKERKQDRLEIKETLKQIQSDLLQSNQYQARARQGIHRRINGMDSALSFIAGRFEHGGDHTAAQAIEQKLHATRGGFEDE